MIHDPAIGVRTLPLAEVSKHFTGVVLELAPATNFRVVHARAPVRLSSLWSRMTGFATAFLHVIVLSIVLQIAAFAAPFQIQLVIDEAVFHADQDLLTVLALAFGALVVIQALIEALRGWALRVFGHLLSFQIAGNLVRHMLRLPGDFFEKRHVGDMLSRIGAVQPIQDAITRGLVSADHRWGDGIGRNRHPVLLFGDAGRDRRFAILLHLGSCSRSFQACGTGWRRRSWPAPRSSPTSWNSVRAATTIKLMGREAERESAWRNLSADVTNAGIAVGKFQISMTLSRPS